jgi:hypothetical protein
MEFKLKPIIFGFFGVNAKVNDSYKDVTGNGINERYQQCVAEDYDENISDLVDNFVDRTIVPAEIKTVLIPLLESMLGNPVIVLNDVIMRRKIIRFAQNIYNVKSTAISYEILFKLLGFDTVVIQEFVITTGFDSDVTFDDTDRIFDGSEKNCSDYSIILTGGIGITEEIYSSMFRIIAFLEPINADLRDIFYNGNSIFINQDIFDDSFDESFG